MPNPFELRGKRVLVVGLARTGVATALFCAARGANVTATDARTEDEIGEAFAPLRTAGVKLELAGHRENTFFRSGPDRSQSRRARRCTSAAIRARKGCHHLERSGAGRPILEWTLDRDYRFKWKNDDHLLDRAHFEERWIFYDSRWKYRHSLDCARRAHQR